MKKYLSFFRLRFAMGLQYRVAALAGIVTQFFWGFMEIMIFRAFYRTDAAAFPMTLSATSSYIWLQQAFLAFFTAWMMENEIFDSTTKFMKEFQIGKLLFRCNAGKMKGAPMMDIFRYLFCLVFSNRSMYMQRKTGVFEGKIPFTVS